MGQVKQHLVLIDFFFVEGGGLAGFWGLNLEPHACHENTVPTHNQ